MYNEYHIILTPLRDQCYVVFPLGLHRSRLGQRSLLLNKQYKYHDINIYIVYKTNIYSVSIYIYKYISTPETELIYNSSVATKSIIESLFSYAILCVFGVND